MPLSFTHHASSFRDPSGYIFEKDGTIYRQVNKVFSEDFDFFISGGCYDSMVTKKMLVRHETIHENITGDENWHVTLKPEKIPFISYPYEWSFDMLKDAALLTLALLRESLEWGMVLKDATPYNIQWQKGRLLMIDSLSFEKYDETQPWIAYRQFCEMFLSPLLLAHYAKQPVQDLLVAYPDGIPLALTSSLLPRRTRFSVHVYLHIHMHAKYSLKKPGTEDKKTVFSKNKLLNLVKSLEILIQKLFLRASQSTWSEYYDEASERSGYLEQKQKIITSWINKLDQLDTVLDLGANTGEFSKIAARRAQVVAADFDPYCINRLYQDIKTSREENILPVILDLSKPSPATGLNNEEHPSFIQRSNADLVLALALIHHLSIGKNIPFEKTAALFSMLGTYLIIEFVPKQDEKIKFMLEQKKDIYTGYNEENFSTAFAKYFSILETQTISGSDRVLYLMKKNER